MPVGMSGNKKIKDIFIDMKIPKEERDNIPDLIVVWVQCLVAVLVLESARLTRSIEPYPTLQWDQVKAWLPINLMFIAMLYTGFMSYVYLSVPMILIIKNLTNVLTVGGDYLFFNER